MAILNLGTGNKPVDGAVNHDIWKHRPEIDVAWDLNDFPWPWADGSFDLVVALAVFEHLTHNLLVSVNECWRLLRPEGVLYLKLPYWKADNSYRDPTHVHFYSVRVLDAFDPTTSFGAAYSFYTDRKWQIIKGPRLNDAKTSFHAKMRVVKSEELRVKN